MEKLVDLSINGIASCLQLTFRNTEINEMTLNQIIDQILNDIEIGKKEQLSSSSELLYQESELSKKQFELSKFLNANNGIDQQIKDSVEKIFLEVISRLQGKQIVVTTPRKQFSDLTAQHIAFLFDPLREINCINDRKTELGDGLSILFGISSDNIRTRLSNSDNMDLNDYNKCVAFMEIWMERLKNKRIMFEK